jgi:hypothetical protein
LPQHCASRQLSSCCAHIPWPPSLELPLLSPLSDPVPELESSGPVEAVVEMSVVPEDSVASVVLDVVDVVVEAVVLVVGAVVLDVVLPVSLEVSVLPSLPSLLPHPAAMAPTSQSNEIEIRMCE